MIRDLVEIAIDMIREEKLEDVADKAELNAEERLLDLLLPPPRSSETATGGVTLDSSGTEISESQSRTREKLRQQLREGKLDERMVEIEVRERNFPSFEIISQPGRRRDGRQHQGHVAEHLRAAQQEAEDEGQRGLRIPDSGRRAPPDRHGSGDAHGDRPRGEFRHHLSRRNRQDRRHARAGMGRTFPEKACSATFSPSWKARP